MTRQTIVLAWLLGARLAAAQEPTAVAMAAGDMSDQTPGQQKNQQTPVGRWSEAKQQAPGNLYDEALRAAPILWFSDDEPLLRVGANGTRRLVPAPLPCDPLASETKRPVVYYKLDDVRVNRALKDEERQAVYAGRLPLDAIERMRINYYFYYPEDMGLNPHIHDIESVSVELDVVRKKKGGSAVVERNRVTGWAHGSELMANILQIKPSIRNSRGALDTRSPVTVLVEEGKHASCPDRNGDGIYTPGIDVNVRVPDAWGVRDVFGGGVVGSRYQSFMTKNRLTPVMGATRKLTEGLETLTEEVHQLRFRRSLSVPSPGTTEETLSESADNHALHDPARYRIGPDLPWDHDVFLTYERERLANGGLEYPSLRYELRDIGSIPPPYCAAVEAPFPRGWTETGSGDAETAKRLDWSRQKHIFEAACPLDRDANGGDPAPTEEEGPRTCGFLNLPASVAGIRHLPPINRTKLTYKYGPWWPIQPFRNAYVGARYDRGAPGFTAGVFSGYGLPTFGGWFNAGATVVRRDDTWAWSTNGWFTPSIATLATWYVGAGYDHGKPALGDQAGHFALEGGVQVRHQAFGVRIGVRSRLSHGSLAGAGIVSEIVYGPAPRGTRVH